MFDNVLVQIEIHCTKKKLSPKYEAQKTNTSNADFLLIYEPFGLVIKREFSQDDFFCFIFETMSYFEAQVIEELTM